MKRIFFLLMIVTLLSSGCATVDWTTGDKPIFRYGERVRVINNLKYEVVITYRTWGSVREARFFPGQEGELSSLSDNEYLVAQVYNEENQIIGTTDFKVRSQKSDSQQLWRITSFRKLR
ncbi:MAG: hypothetical protein PHN37_00505 [Candidatus Pacebacteria bacterium]|nr:hypothetical protein [Candidatus Paceibacterota bacterium]